MRRRILTLSELSQSLESDEERVAPFVTHDWAPEPAVPTEAALIKATASSVSYLQSSVWATNANNRIAPSDRLANFHRRLNKVLLDTVALDREKERLDVENAKLSDLIGQYVSGTVINDAVLRDENPVFVINGR